MRLICSLRVILQAKHRLDSHGSDTCGILPGKPTAIVGSLSSSGGREWCQGKEQRTVFGRAKHASHSQQTLVQSSSCSQQSHLDIPRAPKSIQGPSNSGSQLEQHHQAVDEKISLASVLDFPAVAENLVVTDPLLAIARRVFLRKDNDGLGTKEDVDSRCGSVHNSLTDPLLLVARKQFCTDQFSSAS